MKLKLDSRRIAKLAVLTALSVLLVAVLRLPIVPAVPYLEYDAADVPILIGTFLYGPLAGVFLTLVVSVLQGLIFSSASGVVGVIMHFLATSALVLTAGLIYRYRRRMSGAVIGLILGSVAMTLVMIPLNYLLTPIYAPAMTAKDITAVLPFIVLFNVLKAGINSSVTFLLYKGVGRLFREELGEGQGQDRPGKRPE